MGLRHICRAIGTTAAVGAIAVGTLAFGAGSAQADDTGSAPADGASAPADGTSGSARTSTRIVIPLPKFTVSRVCGARDDILTLDPVWQATWGDKVEIFPNSLTFQGGNDGDLAKPAGMIRPEFRADYRWAGSKGAEWASWLLYPGTVKPVVDRDVPCPTTVEAPSLTRTVICGARNDTAAFADQTSAEHWRITARTWIADTLTVSLRVRRGYVGPGGAREIEIDYVDTGACPASSSGAASGADGR